MSENDIKVPSYMGAKLAMTESRMVPIYLFGSNMISRHVSEWFCNWKINQLADIWNMLLCKEMNVSRAHGKKKCTACLERMQQTKNHKCNNSTFHDLTAPMAVKQSVLPNFDYDTKYTPEQFLRHLYFVLSQILLAYRGRLWRKRQKRILPPILYNSQNCRWNCLS